MSVCAKLKKSAERGLDVLSTSQTALAALTAPTRQWRGEPTREEGSSAVRLRTQKGPFVVDQTTLGALQGRALREGGGLYSPWDDHCPRTFWPIHGRGRDRCIKPVIVVLNNGERESLPGGSAIELHVRCRICEPCLRAKSAFWKLRAMAEIMSAQRTWFVTLTWRPEDRLKAIYAGDRALQAGGVRVPSPQDLFRARLKVLGPEVTRWLQRIRKGKRQEGWPPAAFRYLLVWEEHADGFPHAHLLIHEQQGQTLLKRRIASEWRAGFEKVRLVEQVSPECIHRDAAYVCKYISKSMLSRVRSSLQYGRKRPDFERSS